MRQFRVCLARYALLLLVALGGNEASSSEPRAVDATQPPRVKVLTQQKERVAWQIRLGSTAGAATATDEFILVGTHLNGSREDAGVMTCLRRDTGIVYWKSTHQRLDNWRSDLPGAPIRCRPCVDRDQVFYVSNRGELVSADLNGFHDDQNDGPYVSEESTGSTDVDLHWLIDMPRDLGVQKVDGTEIGNPLPTPVVFGEHVYAVTTNGGVFGGIGAPNAPSLIAVHRATGQVSWTSNAGGGALVSGQWSSPVVMHIADQDVVVLPAGDGSLYGFEPKRGELLWQLDCTAVGQGDRQLLNEHRVFFIAPPVVRGEMLYVALDQNHRGPLTARRPLVAVRVERREGLWRPSVEWSYDAPRFKGVAGTPVLNGKNIYVLGQEGVLHAINTDTGLEEWYSDLQVVR